MNKITIGFLVGGVLLFVQACKKDKLGCSDSAALNYNSDATIDNGSCIYNEENNEDTVYWCKETYSHPYITELEIDDWSRDDQLTETESSTSIYIGNLFPDWEGGYLNECETQSTGSDGVHTHEIGDSMSFTNTYELKHFEFAGWCYNTMGSPTVQDNYVQLLDTNSTTGIIESKKIINGLLPGKKYYLRFYVKGADSEWYSNETIAYTYTDGKASYTVGETIYDNSGNPYPTVILPNGQQWMASDLRTRMHNSGNALSEAKSNYDSTSILYYDAGNIHGVCPDGYKLPEVEDIGDLWKYFKGHSQDMKTVDVKWSGGSGTVANNGSGLNILPNINSSTARYWFVSYGYQKAFFTISKGNDNLDLNYDGNNGSYGIRCIKY